MYEKFYGFTEKPFNTTPDSKFFFPSAKHTEALNSLIYAISEKKGFVVITGEIGSGKTTVSRALLNRVSAATKVALITNTHLTAKELIAEILEELEIQHQGGTKQKLLSKLNNYLIQQLAADINVVLIIDEAQNLSPTVLEEVRMLSNLETEKEKLIQIILMGQPQLKNKLENPKLEQFKQRIAVYYHIYPLGSDESKEYISHRINLASVNGPDIFTPRAIDAVYRYSAGVPRLINLICDSALLSGYVAGTQKITEQIISDVIKEREFEQKDPAGAVPVRVNADSVEGAVPAINLACCSDCQKFVNCETKWLRGVNGEKQFCCPNCRDYSRCIENNTKRNAGSVPAS